MDCTVHAHARDTQYSTARLTVGETGVPSSALTLLRRWPWASNSSIRLRWRAIVWSNSFTRSEVAVAAVSAILTEYCQVLLYVRKCENHLFWSNSRGLVSILHVGAPCVHCSTWTYSTCGVRTAHIGMKHNVHKSSSSIISPPFLMDWKNVELNLTSFQEVRTARACGIATALKIGQRIFSLDKHCKISAL